MCTSPNLMFRNHSPNRRKADEWHFKKFHPDVLDELVSNPFCETYLIPCGRCFECRMQYAKNWAIRLSKELLTSKNAYFLTLTYDDEHLPLNSSLSKDDIRGFIKDLRNYCYYHYKTKDIKYYLCGEYGDNTTRPHYHAIIYNIPREIVDKFSEWFPLKNNTDYIRIKGSCNNYQYYSEFLEKLWSFGRVCVDNVNYEACSYVARYIQKKQYGDNAVIYDKLHIIPPFTLMSLGIGKTWFITHYHEIYKTDEVFSLKKDKVLKSKPPRYFDRLLEKLDLELFERIKSQRDLSNSNILNALNNLKDSEITGYFSGKEYMNKRKDILLIRK